MLVQRLALFRFLRLLLCCKRAQNGTSYLQNTFKTPIFGSATGFHRRVAGVIMNGDLNVTASGERGGRRLGVSYSYACSLDPVVCLAWPFPDVVHIFRVFLIWLCITRRCFPGGFVTFGLVRSRIFGGGCWRNFLALRAASVVRKVIGARASVSVIVFMHHLMHQILHCNCILEYILYEKFIAV